MDPNRVGGPVNELLSDGGMSTMIGGGKGVDKGLVHNLQRMQVGLGGWWLRGGGVVMVVLLQLVAGLLRHGEADQA